jgi:diaminopimelate epimerase
VLANKKEEKPIAIDFEYDNKIFVGYAISMGNPHCVFFLNNGISDFPLENFGKYIERHKIFPNRTNVEIAMVLDKDVIMQRTWERGSGETLACGTGASAVAVVSHIVNATNREVFIKLKGGEVKVKWDNKSNQVFLSGPVDGVFKGEWLLG